MASVALRTAWRAASVPSRCASRPLLVPPSSPSRPQLLPPRRRFHASPRRCNLSKYNLAGLRPATEAEAQTFQDETPAGFGRTHGVATTVRPLAYDPLPPVNARGWRDVSGWRTIYEGVVQPNWANSHGTMHGACAAWLVDNLTGRGTLALGTDDWWSTHGMSLTIDMTYFTPAYIGDTITILVTVERMSASVAHTRCDMFHAKTGERVASGTHVLMWKKSGPKQKAAE